jgi:putative endonuclease
MVHLYILKSIKYGYYYVGHTTNLKDRFNRHNRSESISTKHRGPWQLVYVERFKNRSNAMRREQQIKREKSKKYIERLINRGIAQFG